MTNEEQTGLLQKLITQTRGGQIRWKGTAADTDEFRINFPRSSIEIFITGNAPRIAIFNADGVVIQIIDPNSAERLKDMQLLHSLAKDSAYLIRETLEDIFQNLK